MFILLIYLFIKLKTTPIVGAGICVTSLIECVFFSFSFHIVFTACPLPQRVITTIMAFLSIVMAYMLRVSLSYAITQMVMQPHASSNGTIISDLDICPPFEGEQSINEGQQTVTMHPISAIERFDWSQSLQGLILSSFYWGYIVTHIPGGLLSQKIGGKNTCLIGVLIATICTLVTPLAIQTGTES